MIRHSPLPFLIAAYAVLGVPPAAAQDVPSVGLDEALRMLVQNNLDLRVARARVDQATGLARQAGAFPNPTLGATHEPLSGGSGTYSETYLTASQRLDVSGSRGARSAAAERRRDAAAFAYAADSLRIAFSVKRAHVLAAYARERSGVAARVAEVFREAERSARERYEAGDVSLYALRRIEVERARYETLLADAEIELGAAERALALLVAPEGEATRLAAEPLEATVPPPAPSGLGAAEAAGRRPELATVQAEAEAGAEEERVARAERIPVITATGGFKRQSDDLRGAFFGLSVPLPLFDRGAGAVQAADAGRRAAEDRLALTRRQVASDVEGAAAAYEALSRRSALLPPSESPEGGDLLDIALVAYDEGAMELVELLDAADALHEGARNQLRLRAELWIAYYDLERALGGFGAAPTEDGR